MLAKTYLDLKKKQEKELSDFPIAYAFNDKQLQDALKELGAESVKECVTVFGHGDIVKKDNVKAFYAMMTRHNTEVHDLIRTDEQAAYKAFVYEMDNHEYAINWDGDDEILGCFGIDQDELEQFCLVGVYKLARKEHMRKAREDWGII